MFKLVVLSFLFAVATARPGYLDHSASLLYAAPAAIIHEPAYAKVGAIVKSYPTAVSHQSSSVVHSSAHVVQPILAPILKTTYAAPILHAAPVIHHHSYAAAPILSHSAGWAPSW